MRSVLDSCAVALGLSGQEKEHFKSNGKLISGDSAAMDFVGELAPGELNMLTLVAF